MQRKGELEKQTPSFSLPTSPSLGLHQRNQSIAPRLDTSPPESLPIPSASQPSWHHWFEVCTPAAPVITHHTTQLQHKVTPHGPG